MEYVISRNGLKAEIAGMSPEAQALTVRPGVIKDPDASLSAVSYDKGAWFLQFLEQRFGRDEFDAFLDNATGWGNRSGTAGIPGWDDDLPHDNPFSLRATAAGWDKPASDEGGFSLFDDGPDRSADVQATLDEHEKLIERLRREIQQQREIISALVDALADAGVVSKRQIKHRVKRK